MKSIALIFFTALTLHAGETTHRITGLSEPSREQDLREQMKTIPGMELVSLNFTTTEATFRHDLDTLFPKSNPKKPPTETEVTQKLDSLLRAASRGTFTLKPLGTLPEDKLQKIDIQLGLLDCKGCRFGAYLAIAKLDGVEHATVSEKNQLSAFVDPAKTNRSALIDALKKGRVELATP